MTLSSEALKAAREAIGTGEISWPDVVAAIEAYNAAFFAESAKNSPEIAELVERLTEFGDLATETGILHDTQCCREAASILTALSRQVETLTRDCGAVREALRPFVDTTTQLLEQTAKVIDRAFPDAGLITASVTKAQWHTARAVIDDTDTAHTGRVAGGRQ